VLSNVSLRTKLVSLTALPCVALLGFGGFALNGASKNRTAAEELRDRQLTLREAASEIKYFDEVLTHSAARYISSGGSELWWDRYNATVTQLDADLAKAKELGSAQEIGFLNEVDGANQKLIEMETQIHDLVVAKEFTQASAILEGEYSVQKTIYAAGVEKFYKAVEVRVNQGIQSQVDQVATTQRLLTILSAVALAIMGLAFALAQAIRKPITRLTELAHDSATNSLPAALSKVQNGETAELPSFGSGSTDEIGRLGGAFDEFQGTALRLASDQAALRTSVTEMLVNVGRRNQALVSKMLKYLSELERNERDEERLGELFKLDHLTTRVRRNAESLLVLAGTGASRVSTRPVAMADVINAAISEIEEYSRIDVTQVQPVAIRNNVATDLAHMLAELMENATSFSSPETRVQVSTRMRGADMHIYVVDEGVGFEADELAAMNDRLAQAEENQVHTSKALGLVVVARLARRHGLEVKISDQVTGTAVKITVPEHLLVPLNESSPRPSLAAASSASRAEHEPRVSRPQLSASEQLVAASAAELTQSHIVQPPREEPSEEEPSEDEHRPARRQRGANLFESGRNRPAQPASTSAADADRIASRYGAFQHNVRRAEKKVREQGAALIDTADQSADMTSEDF
jgi:signal transduction histidine kinase